MMYIILSLLVTSLTVISPSSLAFTTSTQSNIISVKGSNQSQSIQSTIYNNMNDLLHDNHHKEQHESITKRTTHLLQSRKRQWIHQSLTYYSTVSREAKRRANGQYIPSQIELNKYKSNFITAKKLYFARHKIKNNQLQHAEVIYRTLIDDLLKEQEMEVEAGHESCDNAQIAISTLLLALLLQRRGDIKGTRATFVRFFRLITMTNNPHDEIKECTCSAKVLQAFALFEMKQKNVRKAYALIQLAVRLDPELEPVLSWKQFRDAEKIMITKEEKP